MPISIITMTMPAPRMISARMRLVPTVWPAFQRRNDGHSFGSISLRLHLCKPMSGCMSKNVCAGTSCKGSTECGWAFGRLQDLDDFEASLAPAEDHLDHFTDAGLHERFTHWRGGCDFNVFGFEVSRRLADELK